MAKSQIPDPLHRRHELEKDLSPERSLAIAEAYLAEDRVVEALAFLVKAEARDRLAQVRDAAVAEGDTFLLREACVALGEEPQLAHWEGALVAAEAAGRDAYAEEARRHAALLREA